MAPGMAIPQSDNLDAKRRQFTTFLKTFSWAYKQVNLCPESESAIEKYLLHVADVKYGHLLGDIEEEYERAIWLRREAMTRNWSPFEQLIQNANEYVLTLADSHYLTALGELAHLTPQSESARPSNSIPFGPIPFPNAPPLAFDDYLDLCEGPHVFGARILWWCAAAQTPEEFGYSPQFTNQLASQPFWFTERASTSIVANQRPLDLLRHAVERILATPQQIQKESSVSEQEPDGPLPGNEFRFRGITAKLTPKPFEALLILWRQRTHKMERRSFENEIWRDEIPSDSTVSSLVSRLNTQLDKGGLSRYLVVRIHDGIVELEVTDRE